MSSNDSRCLREVCSPLIVLGFTLLSLLNRATDGPLRFLLRLDGSLARQSARMMIITVSRMKWSCFEQQRAVTTVTFEPSLLVG